MPEVRSFGGATFRAVRQVTESQSFFFLAGARIAVEKWEMRPGGTEFDFEVCSRETRGGGPADIATTEDALHREFVATRVATRHFGLPVSVGDVLKGQAPTIDFTHGEASPQIFRSSVRSRPVAWSIHFRRTHNPGPAKEPKRPRPASADRTGVARSANVQASGAGAMGAIGAQTFLRVFVEFPDTRLYRQLPRFEGHDAIGTHPTLADRLFSALGR